MATWGAEVSTPLVIVLRVANVHCVCKSLHDASRADRKPARDRQLWQNLCLSLPEARSELSFVLELAQHAPASRCKCALQVPFCLMLGLLGRQLYTADSVNYVRSTGLRVQFVLGTSLDLSDCHLVLVYRGWRGKLHV